MTDGLFAQPRRRVGPMEAALMRTLHAWGQHDDMTGDEWAADRAALRDLARAADLARADAYDGDGSPWVLSQTSRAFREAVDTYRLRMGEQSGDAIDALITAISGPAIRDGAQP